MPERRHERGLIDTSVLIDLDLFDPVSLPAELLISAVTLAEIAAGPHAASDATERARRQERLQRTEATFEPLPVGSENAVVVIDGASNAIIGRLTLPDSAGQPQLRGPVDVALNERTNRVYVAGADSPFIILFDGLTNGFYGLRLGDDWPKALAYNSLTDRLYVPAWSTNRVMVLHER